MLRGEGKRWLTGLDWTEEGERKGGKKEGEEEKRKKKKLRDSQG